MKPLLFLFAAHFIICIAAGYFFHERSESHHDFDPPLNTTAEEERARDVASFHMSETRVTIRFPAALNLYFFAGLLALAVALAIELYERSSAP
jgi:hypothetical protein